MIDYAGIFEMETDELFHRLAAIEDELFLYPQKPTMGAGNYPAPCDEIKILVTGDI